MRWPIFVSLLLLISSIIVAFYGFSNYKIGSGGGQNKPPSASSQNKEFEKRNQWFKLEIENYLKWHNQMMRNNSIYPKRIVRCNAINGLGNAMQIAVSCVLYAIFSERAILIDTKANHWLPPEHWPFENPSHTDLRLSTFENVEWFKSLGSGKGLATADVSCFDWKLDDAPLIVTAGNHATDYFGSLLMVNPYHSLWKKLPKNWFQLIFDNFFPLKRKHIDFLNSYKLNNMSLVSTSSSFSSSSGDVYRIGLQIRTKVPTTGTKQGTDHWYSPPLAREEVWFQAAEMLSHQQSKVAYERVVWFIASQNKTLIEWFRERRGLGNESVVWLDGPMTISYDKSPASVEGKLIGSYVWFLLSECDDIIATDFSSFGQTAAARGGIIPVVCNHHNVCMRRLTAEPAQKYPQPVMPLNCLKDQQRTIQYPAADLTCAFFANLWRLENFNTTTWMHQLGN